MRLTQDNASELFKEHRFYPQLWTIINNLKYKVTRRTRLEPASTKSTSRNGYLDDKCVKSFFLTGILLFTPFFFACGLFSQRGYWYFPTKTPKRLFPNKDTVRATSCIDFIGTRKNVKHDVLNGEK